MRRQARFGDISAFRLIIFLYDGPGSRCAKTDIAPQYSYQRKAAHRQWHTIPPSLLSMRRATSMIIHWQVRRRFAGYGTAALQRMVFCTTSDWRDTARDFGSPPRTADFWRIALRQRLHGGVISSAGTSASPDDARLDEPADEDGALAQAAPLDRIRVPPA